MIIISICIGSACHLKGAERIVALFQEAVEVQGTHAEKSQQETEEVDPDPEIELKHEGVLLSDRRL